MPPLELRELARQLDELGSKTLVLVAFAGATTGAVLSLETRDSLLRFGFKPPLPAVIVFSIIKESGPIITALVVSGRVAADPSLSNLNDYERHVFGERAMPASRSSHR